MGKKLLKAISPLLVVGIWTLGTGIFVFTQDPGEEGWGYLAAIIICVFSLIPLALDLILRKTVKTKKWNFVIQLPIAITIAFLYWKWTFISF